jgi:hypothetical protein
MELFKHIFYKCPRIRSATITADIFHDVTVLPRLEKCDLFEMMAVQWKNLAHLKLELISSESSDVLIQNICTNLPNLR